MPNIDPNGQNDLTRQLINAFLAFDDAVKASLVGSSPELEAKHQELRTVLQLWDTAILTALSPIPEDA